MSTTQTSLTTAIALLGLGCLLLGGCGTEARTAVSTWNEPGKQIRILNPGAVNLDAVVTRDTFNKLFPQTVWFDRGDVVGMYNRETKMTFVVVSQHLFENWSNEMSRIVESMCHEKGHRADDLYEGDVWTELKYTSAPGMSLDTHHYGTDMAADTTPREGVVYSTTVAMAAQVAQTN